MIHLFETLKVVKITETESRMMAARHWGRRSGGLLLNGCRVSVVQGGGDGCTVQINVLNST